MLEEYLLATMADCCSTGKVPGAAIRGARGPVDDQGLFDLVTPFERVIETLGAGRVGPRRSIEGAPKSLRMSIEHRYSLSRWPSFEFVILESERGLAWGQTFARKEGVRVPSLRRVGDLERWSHVESEVLSGLGAPTSVEGWAPWQSAVYVEDGKQVVLCYVFGLLQSVVEVQE